MARIVEQATTQTAAAWAGDFFHRDSMIPGGVKVLASDWTDVTHTIATSAVAILGATAVAVMALPVALPSGAALIFGAVTATLTAAAAEGATALAVSALSAQVASGATATFVETNVQPVTVVSGTLIGRTLVERNAKTPYGKLAVGDVDLGIVCFDLYDAAVNNDAEVYRANAGLIVKENFLPTFAGEVAGVQALVRAAYTCVIGQA